MKKGEIEIQFNWVMVLIAGSLIFLFLFSVIQWFRSQSEKGTSVTISHHLDSIFTSSAVQKDTKTSIEDYPFKQIEFSCNGFRVDNSEKEYQYKLNNIMIFSPTRIEDGQLITWSMSWEVPFRVSNFLFVSSRGVRYVVFGSGDLFEDVREAMEDTKLSVEFNPGSIDDLNHYKIRFIYINTAFDTQPGYLQEFKKKSPVDVTALVISGTSFDSLGSITFYRMNAQVATPRFIPYPGVVSALSYYGKAALFAGIISEDPEDYKCSMDRAFIRLGYVAESYQKSSDELSNFYPVGDECKAKHTLASNILSDMTTYDFSKYPSLVGDANNLELLNNDAERYSCALIY